MMLSDEDFKQLVKLGTLFAVDLIVRNSKDEILVGLRKNSPSKNFWFVPGARIYKEEKFDDFIKRITKTELGVELNRNNLKPIGLYNHIYEDNFFEDKSFGTHYIVLACQVKEIINELNFPSEQHTEYKFIEIKELLLNPSVHHYTKNYFIESAANLFFRF